MLGVAATQICDKVRTYVERELRGVGRTTGEYTVDIYLVAFAGGLYGTLTVGVIPVVGHEAVVVHRKQTVLLVPDEFALTDTVVPMSVGHHKTQFSSNRSSDLRVIYLNAMRIENIIKPFQFTD